jgi:8-oxo-dGTP pyrophosphatase MutT (NUDIX family)
MAKIKDITCAVIIYDALGKVLVGKSNGNNWYDFPKGIIDVNESEIDTVIRETKEEFNITLTKDSLTKIGKFKYTSQKDIIFFMVKYEDLSNDINMDELDCTSYFTRYGKEFKEISGYLLAYKVYLLEIVCKAMKDTLEKNNILQKLN